MTFLSLKRVSGIDLITGVLDYLTVRTVIGRRMPMSDLQEWTSCEVYGHIYNYGSDPEDESRWCLDCGDERID